MMKNIAKKIMLAPMNLLYKISPKLDFKIIYKLKTGYTLDLDNPVAYTEKLNWIKLYEKNMLMTKCCDKFLVRDYVKACGCEEMLNELYWEGFNPEDIPFNDLPDQFAIKVTHGCGLNIICENKRQLDRKKTITVLKKWLKAKAVLCYGEWFYGVEKPRIVVERYLKDEKRNILYDYKIYCFHGEPRFINVLVSQGYHCGNVYDLDFNFMPNVQMGLEYDVIKDIPKPKNLDKMLKFAQKLSKEFLHVRVDLYNINGKIIFGELTFTKSAGFGQIIPHSFDIEMGSWIKLPQKQASDLQL